MGFPETFSTLHSRSPLDSPKTTIIQFQQLSNNCVVLTRQKKNHPINMIKTLCDLNSRQETSSHPLTHHSWPGSSNRFANVFCHRLTLGIHTLCFSCGGNIIGFKGKNGDGATGKQERHNQTSQEPCSASQSLTSWWALASKNDLRIIVGETN